VQANLVVRLLAPAGQEQILPLYVLNEVLQIHMELVIYTVADSIELSN